MLLSVEAPLTADMVGRLVHLAKIKFAQVSYWNIATAAFTGLSIVRNARGHSRKCTILTIVGISVADDYTFLNGDNSTRARWSC